MLTRFRSEIPLRSSRHSYLAVVLFLLVTSHSSLVTVFLPPLVTSLHAQGGGPPGEDVWEIAIDPTDPSILYAGTFGGGVFKSPNGGTSWSAVNSGLTNPNVYALAIDPSSPSTLYAGTAGGGVFKSTNGGTSWTAVNSGLSDLAVSALAVDPSSPATLYAGTRGGGGSA